VRADESQQTLLPLAPDRAGLGEARRDHTQRANAAAEGRLGGVEHLRPGQADHGEVDRIRNLLDRAVGTHARDRLARSVDGIGGAGEVGGEDVAEELAADGAAAARRSDHRDAPGREERAQRRGDCDVVARLDALAEPLGRSDREPQLDLAAAELVRELEARVREDAERRAVVGQHICDEALDARLASAQRELLEKPRPDPAPLLVVRDGEANLRRLRVAQPHPARERDDPLATFVAGERPEQRAALDPVGLEVVLDEWTADGAHPVEPEVTAALGEVLEERDERVRVGSGRRPQPERPAVPEDDVDGSGCFAGGARRQP